MLKNQLKKIFLMTLSICLTSNLLLPPVFGSGNESPSPQIDKADTKQSPMLIWYDEPAPYGNEDVSDANDMQHIPNDGWANWSIPLGNGYMGVRVFGRTESERIQITENSLANRGYGSKKGSAAGLNNFSETYIDFNHDENQIANYRRELNLNEAVSTVSYNYNNIRYEREYFTSYPDKVMVIKLNASEKGALSFTLRPTIPYIQDYQTTPGDGKGKHGSVTADGETGTITLQGNMESYDIDFEGQYKVIPTGGTMSASNDENNDNGTISVAGADSALIIIGIGTNYQPESRVFTAAIKEKLAPYPHPHEKVTKMVSDAAALGYDKLKENHLADYKSLFDRVQLNIGGTLPEITTDQLLTQYQAGASSPYLEELFFQFGRYILIASSRKGCLPANLQGIWNRYETPPWSAGYWHNINVQMNYWPAFTTNLVETFESYADYAEAYREATYHRTNSYIESNYPENYDSSGKPGANGWSIGTGGWPYEIQTTPTNSHSGPGTGAFTSILFWDWYTFTGDKDVLENHTYPAVSGMAQFLSKCLIKQDGKYLVGKSASPEQKENGNYYPTVGCGFDQQMVWQNHAATKEAAELLHINEPIVETVNSQINALDPVQVGYSGQIKEFREEAHYGDIGEYEHRHISHLAGLYPSNLINSDTPAWLDAAKVTLTERGEGTTGWSIAHRMELWARTGDGDEAYDSYQNLLKRQVSPNLFAICQPYFQIDANCGGTAGVAEMLLQSHEGYISLLPALPKAWKSGMFKGLVARGNFEVSASWENENLTAAEIDSKNGGACTVKYPNIANATVTNASGDTVPFTADGLDKITFSTEKAGKYVISGIPEKEQIPSPSNLQISSENSEHVNLSWTSASGANAYNIYRAVESSPSYELIADGVKEASFGYDVPAADSGKQTTYKVTAVSSSGRESKGIQKTLEPDIIPAPTSVTSIFTEAGTLQISAAADGTEKGFALYRYNEQASAFEKIQSGEYPIFLIKGGKQEERYAVSVVRGQNESEKTEAVFLSSDEAAHYFTEIAGSNLLLNKTAESPVEMRTDYPLSNAFDGSLTTRFVVQSQSPDDVFPVTIDLDGTYLLGTLSVDEFRSYKEDTTRSPKTNVEIFDGEKWITIIEDQPLTSGSNQKHTEFKLGQTAQKLRVTFASKRCTIFEIECTQAFPASVNKEKLLTALNYAQLILDEDALSNADDAVALRFHEAFEKAKSAAKNSLSGQAEVDQAAQELEAVNILLRSPCDITGVASGSGLTLNDTIVSGVVKGTSAAALLQMITISDGAEATVTKNGAAIADPEHTLLYGGEEIKVTGSNHTSFRVYSIKTKNDLFSYAFNYAKLLEELDPSLVVNDANRNGAPAPKLSATFPSGGFGQYRGLTSEFGQSQCTGAIDPFKAAEDRTGEFSLNGYTGGSGTFFIAHDMLSETEQNKSYAVNLDVRPSGKEKESVLLMSGDRNANKQVIAKIDFDGAQKKIHVSGNKDAADLTGTAFNSWYTVSFAVSYDSANNRYLVKNYINGSFVGETVSNLAYTKGIALQLEQTTAGGSAQAPRTAEYRIDNIRSYEITSASTNQAPNEYDFIPVLQANIDGSINNAAGTMTLAQMTVQDIQKAIANLPADWEAKVYNESGIANDDALLQTGMQLVLKHGEHIRSYELEIKPDEDLPIIEKNETTATLTLPASMTEGIFVLAAYKDNHLIELRISHLSDDAASRRLSYTVSPGESTADYIFKGFVWKEIGSMIPILNTPIIF